MERTRGMNLNHLQKEVLLRTHVRVSKDKPNSPLLTVESKVDNTLEDLGRQMMQEYVSLDIKNLFGISIIEFSNLSVIDNKLCIETALKIAKDREEARKKVDDKGEENGS